MSDYKTKRAELLLDPRFAWLKVFDRSLDKDIKDALDKVPTTPRYDCFLVDDLINDVSRLLDRCLVYWREYIELEATAIKQALIDRMAKQEQISL